MHVGKSSFVKAYALCDGLGQCAQLGEVNHEKDQGSGLPVTYNLSLRDFYWQKNKNMHLCACAILIRAPSLLRYTIRIYVSVCVYAKYMQYNVYAILCIIQYNI